jgi:hypothetical protein
MPSTRPNAVSDPSISFDSYLQSIAAGVPDSISYDSYLQNIVATGVNHFPPLSHATLMLARSLEKPMPPLLPLPPLPPLQAQEAIHAAAKVPHYFSTLATP